MTTLDLAINHLYRTNACCGIQAPSRVRVNKQWVPIFKYFKRLSPMQQWEKELMIEMLNQN